MIEYVNTERRKNRRNLMIERGYIMTTHRRIKTRIMSFAMALMLMAGVAGTASFHPDSVTEAPPITISPNKFNLPFIF